MPAALYDRIGSAYDATRRADSYIVSRLLAHLEPVAGSHYVDLACGTGNYSLALAAAGLSVVGVDASQRMITAAVGKERRSPSRTPTTRPSRDPLWTVGEVTGLPFRAGAFDGAACTLALRYFKDLEAACLEFGRILGRGRLVIFTATPNQIRRYWLRVYFPQLVDRVAAQAHPLAQILDGLRAAGFANVRTEPYAVRPDVEDLFLYSGKHRPELYLNPAIRAGMWSFATLASLDEEAAGCAALRRDLASGRIRAVMQDAAREASQDAAASADPGAGDYLFVIADRGPSTD
jgi:ubiquinone/menaquinone biosynthesis C-methylase UbiE